MKAEDLQNKTVPQLHQIADEQLGVRLDPKFKKKQMIEKMLEVDKAQQEAAKQQTEETAKQMVSKKDPLLEVRFQNNESQGTDIEFTLDLDGKGPRRFHLYDGQIYKLPLSVINHLNNLTVPNPRYEVDSRTGQVTGIAEGVRNRFSCNILNLTPEQVG